MFERTDTLVLHAVDLTFSSARLLPVDGSGTAVPLRTRVDAEAQTVTLTAPLTAGSNIIYRVTYTKAPSSGISGGTLAQIALSVNANAAPELDLPGTMTVEGDTTGGWVAAYTATE